MMAIVSEPLEHGGLHNADGVEKTIEKLRLRPEFERVDIYFKDPISQRIENNSIGSSAKADNAEKTDFPKEKLHEVELTYKLMPYVIKCFYELNNFDVPDFVYTPLTHPNFPVNGIILTEYYDTEALQNMIKNGVSSFKLVYYQIPEFVGYEVLPGYSNQTQYYNTEKRDISRCSGVKNAIDNFVVGINMLINNLKNPKTFYHLKHGIRKRIYDDIASMQDMKEQLQEWIDELEKSINQEPIITYVKV